jgi:hypothetical protein
LVFRDHHPPVLHARCAFESGTDLGYVNASACVVSCNQRIGITRISDGIDGIHRHPDGLVSPVAVVDEVRRHADTDHR